MDCYTGRGGAVVPIRVLPPGVAARIAAGEVIERPASVVKELIENALDAGATRITVQIERGGVGLIRVVDDGRGIPAGEIALALERHATSKLDPAGDLGAVATLGFRGEALPSIAAAADLEMVSRAAGADAGASVRARDGAIGPVRPAGAAPGTTVTVRELFARQPARRKFLRTPAAEAGQIAQVTGHYALAYPEVAFSLSVDGRRVLSTSGDGDPRGAAAAVYGVRTAAQMLEVAGADPVFAVRGLITPPEVTRAGRGAISLFVNRRWVQHRRLAYAVESGYDTMLMAGRHPIAVVEITVDPREVDVNVHPAKAEVRFRAENEVFRAVQAAVRTALIRLAPVPGVEGRGPWTEMEPPAGDPLALTPQSSTLSWWHVPAPGTLPAPVVPERPSEPPRLLLPALRVVGQVGSTYIITEGPEGMYLIDQHAAHERVLFERIARARAERRPEVQGLLDPITFEATPVQAAALSEYADDLAALGFAVEPFGERTFLLRAVPAALAGRDAARAVADFLDGLAAGGTAGERAERAAMTLACHAAVRAGKTLALDEMRELVRLLEDCASPRTCPHGRPTMIHVSAAALEREFGRR
jgi:DNA mismatch repair protein MutL